ncbi:MAG: SMI1/KNR4 family protein [Sandaracinus sp.]
MSDEALPELISKLKRCFPESAPLTLRPSAGAQAWASAAPRFPGGHARRWFAALDGQSDELPAYDGHSFFTLAEALAAMKVADEIREQPEPYWVDATWISIASDHTSHHLMIDDRDGRVLSVAPDDDHVTVLAESPEAWIDSLVRGVADGTTVWHQAFGLVPKRVIDEVEAHRAGSAGAARRSPDDRVKILAGIGIALVVAALLAVWFELHR